MLNEKYLTFLKKNDYDIQRNINKIFEIYGEDENSYVYHNLMDILLNIEPYEHKHLMLSIFLLRLRSRNSKTDIYRVLNEDYHSLTMKLFYYYIEKYKRDKIAIEINRGGIKKKSGIYFLKDSKKRILYIGKSVNLNKRILESIKEKILTGIYYYSYCYIEEQDSCILEPYLINLHKPPLNIEFNYENDNSFNLDIPTQSEDYDV